ncbi:MAG TPA: hypothetical protein VGN95_23815 [Pyrinomonadaceae bacterium]|jgi:hypothetical protein|nr:hypothetical protein [Pyrinomonadaceae bacterium]
MPSSYPDEAIQDCQRLYLKFNGQQHDRIQAEMRKTWPGWSKQNLYTRGKGPNQKIGWIDKYGFEEALRLHLALRPTGAQGAAEKIFTEIEAIRKTLFEKVKTLGPKAERDLIYQHRDYTKLSIEALSKLNGAGDTFEGFVAFWERLLDLLTEIEPKAATELLKVSDAVIEKAKEVYGQDDSRM